MAHDIAEYLDHLRAAEGEWVHAPEEQGDLAHLEIVDDVADDGVAEELLEDAVCDEYFEQHDECVHHEVTVESVCICGLFAFGKDCHYSRLH